MTPFQQIALLDIDAGRATNQIKFDTYGEYLTWLNSRDR